VGTIANFALLPLLAVAVGCYVPEADIAISIQHYLLGQSSTQKRSNSGGSND